MNSAADLLGSSIGWFRAHWREVLDLVLVAGIFYYLFRLMRGTRAAQMFVGLVLVVVASLIASWLKLAALNYIADSLRTVWIVVFVILFQPELRGALMSLGKGRLFSAFTRGEEFTILGEIVRAAESLSDRRCGAIIVIEREVGLKNYVETGTPVEGRITHELLTTLFTPPSPLHDGAAIISGNRVLAAGCILPLSQNPRLIYALGTRHRAALGVSEETDAVVVVVSEESGAISIAERGRLLRNLDPGALRSTLSTFFRLRGAVEEAAVTAAATTQSEVVPADTPKNERIQA
jgi:diadenylate cyclase